MQFRVVWPALVLSGIAASLFMYFSIHILAAISLIFTTAIVYGLLKTMLFGRTFLIFTEDQFEVPARVFKPKRNIFYKDITQVGKESVRGTHFLQCHVKNEKILGLTNRLCKTEADFELAVKTILRKTNKRFDPF